MRCSKCGSDNREGRKFCTNCGAPLVATCPKCSAPVQPDEKFCGECGAALGEVSASKVDEAMATAASAIGERRHLTVLFCDLVGSTEIAAQLDPEEWRELVASYHRAASAAITRYGGHVAKYLGDGVMAYFGWPEAHDNDGERATRAGLAIHEAISKLNDQSMRPKLSARVGIDSGLVVVGAGASKDPDVFGEAPNIAARVQAMAGPGAVLITSDTHRLISGMFVVDGQGEQALKGIAQPVELYRVLRPTGVRERLDVRRLTAFVGREEDLHLLLSRWQRTREGEGQVVLVVGEAGIGKSRLVAEFRERLRDTPHIWLDSAGEQFFENTPFHAVRTMLARWLENQDSADANERLEPLERSLTSSGLNPDEAVPLLADLLQIPLAGRYTELHLAPEEQRRRLLAVLTGWILGSARMQPVIRVVEDIHWLDPSTMELHQLLAEQGATAPLMLLYTARPEVRVQWPLRAHHTQITLNRLSTRNVREMIAQVAARSALANETIDTVIERTSGVPLFVEELTRAVLESGNLKLRGREIPATLHDSLMARLDRLGPAKELIQVSAVIGSEFSYELLHAVHPMPETELQRALLKLIDAELLYVRGIVPDATYLFKHALIRDAAYEALLKSRRKDLHRRVAVTIDGKFTSFKETHPEVLARHWTEADEIELAIAEWERAGSAAQQRNAFTEALENYRQAIQLLADLPESPRRDERDFKLSREIQRLCYMTKGFAAPETVDAIKRCETLAEKTGNLAAAVGFINSRGFSAYFSGDLRTAGELADRGLELASGRGWPGVLANIHFLQVVTRNLTGDLGGVEKHFTAGLKYFDDPDFLRDRVSRVAVFSTAAGNAWMLGQAEVGRERSRLMMAAVDTTNSYVVASAHLYAAGYQDLIGDYEGAENLAVQALELSEKHQLPYTAGFSRCLFGHARAHLGHPTEGVALIREGIDGLLQRGLRLRIGYFTALLAEAKGIDGDISDALATVDRAIELNPEVIVYKPEILRVRGELQLKLSETALAESNFRDSIAMARDMGAKAWELRTMISLAHLLRDNGRRDEARSMLSEIYNWFTEGLDTADLKDAKALLDELGN